MPLPHETIFQFYEGLDSSQYTKVTGSNLNAPRNQLLENDQYLLSLAESLNPGSPTLSDLKKIIRVNPTLDGYDLEMPESLPTPDSVVGRDENGRFRVVDPVAPDDVATKSYAENNANIEKYPFSWTGPIKSGQSLDASAGGYSPRPKISALNSTDVAMVEPLKYTLRTYRFNGVTWSQLGNTLNFLASSSDFAISALSSTSVSLVDDANELLKRYTFDGTNWTQSGTPFSLGADGTIENPAITALGSDTIAYIDSNKDLKTFTFDGTDWAQVGNSLTIPAAAGTFFPALTTVSSNQVALFDSINKTVRVFEFDGTDWAQVGNASPSLGGGDTFSVTMLNSSDILWIDLNLDTFITLRWDGSDWVILTTQDSYTSTPSSLTTLKGGTVALAAGSNFVQLTTYRLGLSLGAPHSVSGGAF